jgi:hypothetical protein
MARTPVFVLFFRQFAIPLYVGKNQVTRIVIADSPWSIGQVGIASVPILKILGQFVIVGGQYV